MIGKLVSKRINKGLGEGLAKIERSGAWQCPICEQVGSGRQEYVEHFATAHQIHFQIMTCIGHGRNPSVLKAPFEIKTDVQYINWLIQNGHLEEVVDNRASFPSPYGIKASYDAIKKVAGTRSIQVRAVLKGRPAPATPSGMERIGTIKDVKIGTRRGILDRVICRRIR